MFKELKLIKLLIIGGLLVGILFKIDFLKLSVYQLYTDKTSYSLNETVKIYASSKAKYPVFDKAIITDLNGEEIAEVRLNLAHSKNKPDFVLSQGDKIESFVELKLDEKFKPGIYSIGNNYPIIISANTKSDITIVYPYLNNIIDEQIETESAISLGLEKTSINRSISIDKYTLGINQSMQYLDSKFSVNYINDIDLEEFDKINNTKLLLIYGRSGFWTPKMKSSLKKFIKEGGNVVLISSYLLNNICWYNEERNLIVMYDKSRAESIESYLGYDGDAPRYVVGSSYLFGGKSEYVDYKIIEKNHPLFEGMNKLAINAELYNSPAVLWESEQPKINVIDTDFYSHRILAYNRTKTPYGYDGVKGIFELQLDSSSGKIINLGTDQWCLEENQTLINNAVDYLLK